MAILLLVLAGRAPGSQEISVRATKTGSSSATVVAASGSQEILATAMKQGLSSVTTAAASGLQETLVTAIKTGSWESSSTAVAVSGSQVTYAMTALAAMAKAIYRTASRLVIEPMDIVG